MAKIIEVIEVWERRGKGTEEDVVRKAYQLWSKEGELIHEFDPEKPKMKKFIEKLKNMLCYSTDKDECVLKHTCPSSKIIDELMRENLI